jgi:hypothetical protein
MSINKIHEDISGLSSSSYPTGSAAIIKDWLEPSSPTDRDDGEAVIHYFRKKIDELITEVNILKNQ